MIGTVIGTEDTAGNSLDLASAVMELISQWREADRAGVPNPQALDWYWSAAC